METKVLKFGGSSVANSNNIKKVIDIILESQKESNCVIVVSALGGITDELIKLATLASRRNEEYKIIFNNICERHNQAIRELVNIEDVKKVLDKIYVKYNELEEILKEVYIKGEISKRSLDAVVSFGEQFSAYIISEATKSRNVICEFIDSRLVIKTDDNFGEANVDIENSYQLIAQNIKNKGKLFIMGGFIGSTLEGITTTLGRGGSDYTASLVGAAINASIVEIWTDVDGLMTADPRTTKEATIIPEISYDEAEKMALAGAKVIHPKTMKPARLKNIPIYIKNTFNPKGNGTKIK